MAKTTKGLEFGHTSSLASICDDIAYQNFLPSPDICDRTGPLAAPAMRLAVAGLTRTTVFQHRYFGPMPARDMVAWARGVSAISLRKSVYFRPARTNGLIHFVTTRAHQYTLVDLVAREEFDCARLWSYEYLLTRKRAPGGTWIFTDIERLSAAELELAAMLANDLANAGARVLNHPARALARFETMRCLKKAGINSIGVWRADSDPRPDRFPVFVRTTYDHRHGQFELLHTQDALDEKLHEMVRSGSPLRGKIVIEYVDAQILPNIWHKAGAFRVAGRTIKLNVVFDECWVVKNGFTDESLDARPDKAALKEIERDILTSDSHDEILSKVFELAGIDYGRADFSIKDDRLEVFEINTNPYHPPPAPTLRSDPGNAEDLTRKAEAFMESSILQLNDPNEEMIDLRETMRNSGGSERRKHGPLHLWRP